MWSAVPPAVTCRGVCNAVRGVRCRREYPTVPRYALWIMTEIAIIGADIQEVRRILYLILPYDQDSYHQRRHTGGAPRALTDVLCPCVLGPGAHVS